MYLESSEVNDAVNVGVGRKHLVKGSWVGDISLDELRPLAGDQFNAIEDLFGRVVQVVSDDDLVTSLDEGEGRERADIARSSVGVSQETGACFCESLPRDENRTERHCWLGRSRV